MKAAPLPTPVRGIIPPMVTPLEDQDRLDVAGLERLVEHILAGGVHGLFILGSTGEAPSLSARLRIEVLKRVCAQVAGRVPVLVGISDTSFSESVALACQAHAAGASALVLAPPFYFSASQAELLRYLENLIPALPLPVLLYNAPSFTKLSFEPETVHCAAAIPNVVGLKDSSADRVYFHHVQYLLRERPEFSLLVGPEELLAETLLFGGHGGVCGGANLWPELYVDLYKAAMAEDLRQLAVLHELVMYINARLYRVTPQSSSLLRGMKCALSVMGLCRDHMAQPFEPFPQPQRDAVGELLKEFASLIESRRRAHCTGADPWG